MRCPRCGPRPESEFRLIDDDVAPGADAKLVPIELWVHQHCKDRKRRKVYKVAVRRRILRTA